MSMAIQNSVVPYLLFWIMATTMLGTSHGAATTLSPISGCPPSTSISPCTCSTSQPYMGGLTDGLYIYCNSFQNVTNSQLSNVLEVFLSPQYINPVVSISASQNQLTQIPSQISQFKSLTFLDLSYNQITNISSLSAINFSSNMSYTSIMLMSNKITSIPSGTFNCSSASLVTIDLSMNNITSLPTNAFTFPPTATMMMNYLYLQNNQITNISPGAFQGNYTGIMLDNNNLTNFQSSVFQSLMSNGTRIGISGNPIDCTTNLCDLAWLILDSPQLLTMYIMGYACSNGTFISNLSPLGFTSCNITTTTLQPNTQLSTTSVPPTSAPTSGCPPSTSISPCSCGETYMNGQNGLSIYCNSFQNVTDSQLSDVLDVFLSPQYISPVVVLIASFNQLTRVPSQISKFNSLEFLDFSVNQITNISPLSGFSSNTHFFSIMLMGNKITSIPSGKFNFTSAGSINIDLSSNNITSLPTNSFTLPSTNTMMMSSLNLQNNQITTISPGAFQGGNYSSILLNNNNLTNFQSSVFQSWLSNGARIGINGNPIDCMTNLCDLVWLILDNPQLLMNANGGTCSNGTTFSSLNPMGFTSCNITTTTLQPNTQLTTTSIPPTSAPISGCPPSTSISPCTCSTSYMLIGISTGLSVSCYNNFQNITDSQLSNALDVFLSPQYISPVVQIMAMQNQLTQVPSQISKFKSLAQLDLSYNQITNISPLSGLSFPSNASYVSITLMNNKITSIPSGMLNFTTSISIDLSFNNITSLPTKAFTFPPTATMMTNTLNLRNNQITTISPGAFQGSYSWISLDNNNLTNFQSSVFQSLLNSMVSPNYGSISILENPINCVANLCDLAWLILDNPPLVMNARGGTCSNGTAFINLNPLGFTSCNITTTTMQFTTTSVPLTPTHSLIVGCPSSTSISPCTCDTVYYNNTLNGLSINCEFQNLTDSQLSNVLDVFLSPQYVSPVFRIKAYQNKLTRVPSQISHFKAAYTIDFSNNQITNISSFSGTIAPSNSMINIILTGNKITSIPSGIFNCASAASCFIELSSNNITSIPANAFIFPQTNSLMTNGLSLYNNQISTIAPGAFQGNYSYISLQNNNLTNFQSSVYQSLLNSMVNSYGSVFINGNPINCVANLCDLAWLIRDNPQFLNIANGGTCSNGTTFSTLNPLGFTSCSSPTTTVPPTTTTSLPPTTSSTKVSSTSSTATSTTTSRPTSTTTSFSTTTSPRTVGCPPSASISPCSCTTSIVNAITGLNVNCTIRSLTDLQLSNVLNVFILPQFISPVFSLYAAKNQLINVPSQISKFVSMTYLDLSSNQIANISALSGPSSSSAASISIYLTSNKITSIPSGAFNYPNVKSIGIQLGSNQITNINPNSFIFPMAATVTIELQSNQITAIPSTMFNYPTATVIYLGFLNNNITAIPSPMFNYPSAKYLSMSLGNNKILSIPSNTFTCPLATFVSISLSGNQITSIPSGAFNYTSATSGLAINLASNNISTVPVNAFISPSTATTTTSIYLNNNQITAISPGAFQGNYSQIMLDNNKLIDLPSSVFQSMLYSIAGHNNSNSNRYSGISGNPIDCLNNLCNLAWLIRDNRQLLNYVIGGKCSNGTVFTSLNPLGFTSCNPTTTSSTTVTSTTKATSTSTTSRLPSTSTTTTSRLPTTTSTTTARIPTTSSTALQTTTSSTTVASTTTARPIILTCPSAASISPCTCTVSSIYRTSRLNCNSQRLNDSQLSNVLNAFLAPGVAPLVQLDACCNQLTQIPNQIISAQFPSLAIISLYSNQITSVPTGAFTSSPPASIGIDLHSNKLTAIPSGAFNLPKATSVQISLSSNQITSIPSGVFSFPNATSIFINFYSNKITSVPSSAFNYPSASQIFLALANNQLTMLQPGTFQGDNFAIINLDNNKLVRFDANVFKPTLQSMLSNIASYVSIATDPIDCSTYVCDLAWLIRDNPEMLGHVQGGTCSNGTAFTDLNPMAYSDCLMTDC